MQHAPMRDCRLYKVGVAGRALQTRKLLQPILDLADRGRRRIEREVQHGGCQRAGGSDHRPVARRGKTGTEYSEIDERVPQQWVPALELLDEDLLLVRAVGQDRDGGT